MDEVCEPGSGVPMSFHAVSEEQRALGNPREVAASLFWRHRLAHFEEVPEHVALALAAQLGGFGNGSFNFRRHRRGGRPVL